MGNHRSILDCNTISKIISLLNVPVLSANHRLAPEHPFPCALDDLVTAYHWLIKELSEEDDDHENIRILVAGESAGGGLAAELCQRLLDEKVQPLPVAQILMQPMLDDRTCVDPEMNKLYPHPVWNNTSNMYAWSQYMCNGEHKPGDEVLPKYMAASRREDLSNLPPAWIMTGDAELFCQESKAYAERLVKCGVIDTVYLEVKGGYHACLSLALLLDLDACPSMKNAWKSFEEFALRYI